jgi:hypothetical protein
MHLRLSKDLFYRITLQRFNNANCPSERSNGVKMAIGGHVEHPEIIEYERVLNAACGCDFSVAKVGDQNLFGFTDLALMF